MDPVRAAEAVEIEVANDHLICAQRVDRDAIAAGGRDRSVKTLRANDGYGPVDGERAIAAVGEDQNLTAGIRPDNCRSKCSTWVRHRTGCGVVTSDGHGASVVLSMNLGCDYSEDRH